VAGESDGRPPFFPVPFARRRAKDADDLSPDRSPLWTHETHGEIWSSPLLADGKVYVTTRGRRVWVLAAGRRKKVLGEVQLDSPIHASPIAANGRLYIATEKYLYAVEQGATPK